MSTIKSPSYRDFMDSEAVVPSRNQRPPWFQSTESAPQAVFKIIFVTFNSNVDSIETSVVDRRMSSAWVDSRLHELKERASGRGTGNYFHYVYSAGGHAAIRPLSNNDYQKLKSKIQRFRELRQGWDSYDAVAPSSLAISLALKLVEELERVDILPEWVTPTSDSSILLSAKKAGTLLKWEIDSDGDIAVMLQPRFSPATYHDLAPGEIGSFLKRNLPQA